MNKVCKINRYSIPALRFFSLIKVADKQRPTFGNWITRNFAPDEVRLGNGLAELNINMTLDFSLEVPSFISDNRTAYDAILETEFDSHDAFFEFFQRLKSLSPVDLLVTHDYSVRSKTVWQHPLFEPGLPTTGYKLFRTVNVNNLPTSVLCNPGILKTHGNDCECSSLRFMHHFVDKALSSDAPLIRDVLELHFPNKASLRNVLSHAENSDEEISNFPNNILCKNATWMLAQEYVF